MGGADWMLKGLIRGRSFLWGVLHLGGAVRADSMEHGFASGPAKGLPARDLP